VKTLRSVRGKKRLLARSLRFKNFAVVGMPCGRIHDNRSRRVIRLGRDRSRLRNAHNERFPSGSVDPFPYHNATGEGSRDANDRVDIGIHYGCNQHITRHHAGYASEDRSQCSASGLIGD